MTTETTDIPCVDFDDDDSDFKDDDGVVEEEKSILNTEQLHALSAIEKGLNVFITGGAGVGKTLVISMFEKLCKSKKKSVHITAMTALAAYQVSQEGTTLHLFGKMGIQKLSVDETQSVAKKHREYFKSVKTLVIDEISMCLPTYFEQLSLVCGLAREDPRPFGGIQIVAVGDFFQLPPVATAPQLEGASEFIFELDLWKRTIHETVVLTQVHRQKDLEFVKLLNRVRVGDITSRDIASLMQRLNAPTKVTLNEQTIEPTILYGIRKSVDAENQSKLQLLKTPEIVLEMKMGHLTTAPAVSSDPLPPRYNERKHIIVEGLIKRVPVPQMLRLKVGAQVMLVTNRWRENLLVNGSRGVVTSIDDGITVMFSNSVEFKVPLEFWDHRINQRYTIFVAQIPLVLAYSMTIHKSQGQSIGCLALSLDKKDAFAYGQAYVGLSRVTSLDGLCLLKFDPDAIRANPKVVDYYKTL